ncbi:MAG: GTPase HflX [Pseudomonadota bacterium]|nr:MAG: GTPase HflX [Pseudomonadota bacterium]
MFERPRGGERAILVHVDFGSDTEHEDLQEFRELAASAGAEVVHALTVRRASAEPRYLIGTGKADEIRDSVAALEAELVLFNHSLSPGQERNLERLFQCRALDRTGLILDIFAQRARSHEGKLQVELAQLKHLSTRLVRGWTHLERQKGGIGLRGPGETQLETDRRLLGIRIKQLQKRLGRVRRQRDQGRRARNRAEVPTVSLVGYTNAGKSTLFNRLTDAGVMAADQLFATLDPTLRRVELPAGNPMVLADTVGFIRHLPHDLVAAFRSTLQETREANLLLHVIDAASERREGNIEQVNVVLDEIGARDLRQLEVYNKIDMIPGARPRLDRDSDGRPRRVWMSAATGEGLDLLLEALAELLRPTSVHQRLFLPPEAGRLRALIYRDGQVLDEQIADGGGWTLDVVMARHDWDALCKREGLETHVIREERPLRLAAGGEGP